MRRFDPLVRLSRPVALAAGALLVVLTTAADYATGEDVTLTLFYLVPVALVSWTAGVVPGLITSALSAVGWLAVDRLRYHPITTVVEAWDLAMQFGIFAMVSWLLGELRQRLETEAGFAHTDALTGLPNRRAFYMAAVHEIERLRRHGRPLTMVFLDVDDFKAVNDLFGHAAGDELLRRVGHVLRERLRAVDIVARLGGDEFALLLPETAEEPAERLCADIIALLSDSLRAAGTPAGVSLGVATFDVPPVDVDHALRAADSLLYEAKREGKARACHGTYMTQDPLAARERG